MIYATIDVDLRDHERATLAGLAAMGLWTWAMLYARGQKMSGTLARAVVMRSPWGEPADIEQAATKLVEVGLWSVVDGGWAIGNYAAKNRAPPPDRRRPWIPAWLRRAVLRRDGGICRICSQAIVGEKPQLDHVRPYSLGGGDTLANLQAAHALCNVRKKAKWVRPS